MSTINTEHNAAIVTVDAPATACQPDFRLVFEAMPGYAALLSVDAPKYTILAVSDVYLSQTATTRKQVVGKGVFESFPENPGGNEFTNQAILRNSLQQAITLKVAHTIPAQRYDFPDKDGNFMPHYWMAVNKPVLDADGNVCYIIHSAEEVTDVILSRQREQKIKGIEQAYNLFTQTPVAIQVFSGPDLIIELANEPTLALWNKTDDVIGKPLLQVLPELDQQGITDMIQQVRITGTSKQLYDMPVAMNRHGNIDIEYFTFIVSPYYNEAKTTITGVLVIAHEVTARITVEKALTQKEQSLELAIQISELGLFNVDIKNNTATYSDKVMEWFSLSRQNVPVEELISKAYPDDVAALAASLEKTIANEWAGKHDQIFRIVHQVTGTPQYLRSIGEVQYTNGVAQTFSGVLQDVTAQVLSNKNIKASEQHARSLVESASFPIGVYIGEDMRIELANEAMMDVWGKGSDVIHKKYADLLPEFHNQAIFDQLHDTFTTGVAFHAKNQRVDIDINGKLTPFYFNYSFTPLYDVHGTIYGILNTGADVTDLNMALQRVEESEARFRSMAEGTEILIAVADETGKANYFNSAWEILTGRERNTLLYFGWSDLLHPDDLELYVETYLHALKKMEPFSCEVRVLNALKEYRWLLAKGIARFTPDNLFAGYTCSFLDITERRLVEKNIRESEEQFRSLADQAPITIFMADVAGSVTYCNKEWLTFTGQTFEQAIGIAGWQNVIHADDLDQLMTTYLAATSSHTTYSIEVRMRRWDGQYRYVHYNGGPRYLPNGAFAGYIGTGLDKTEQKNAEDALKKSEHNLRNIILQAPVAMCITRGRDFVVEIANDRMFELLGRPSTELLNKSIFEGLPETEGDGYEEWLLNVFLTGETFTGNGLPMNLLRKGEPELVYLNLVFEAFREADGSVSGVLAVMIDVTGQVLAHQKIEEVVAQRTKQLAEINLQLQQSNTELNQFAYVASHDLQEPLRKIRTFTDFMQSTLPEIRDDTMTYINKIRSSSERMQTLIHDLLSFSLLSREQEEHGKVDLNKTLNAILTDHELHIEQLGAIIQIGNLPILEAVPYQMNQLFTNLISNALKFNKNRTGLHIDISSRILSPGEVQQHKDLRPQITYHAITVRDNGVGFSQEYAEQIFVIFQRLHGKIEYAGTGIGLAMCKKIAMNHHGTIYAISSLNEGAAFIVVLPA